MFFFTSGGHLKCKTVDSRHKIEAIKSTYLNYLVFFLRTCLQAGSKQEFSKPKGCPKVWRGHMQARALFLLPLKSHLIVLYHFSYLSHPWYLWPYRTVGWGPSKRSGHAGQVVFLWLLQKECMQKEKQIRPNNSSCVSSTAWEKSSFSPLSLETLLL